MTTIKNLGKEKTAVLLSVLTVLILGMSVVLANGPAIVLKDISCGVLIDTEGNSIYTTDTHAVYANNKDENGNSKLTCLGEVPAGYTPPVKTTHLNHENTGASCYTAFGSTTNWKAVITPSGKVMLSCHYKAPKIE